MIYEPLHIRFHFTIHIFPVCDWLSALSQRSDHPFSPIQDRSEESYNLHDVSHSGLDHSSARSLGMHSIGPQCIPLKNCFWGPILCCLLRVSALTLQSTVCTEGPAFFGRLWSPFDSVRSKGTGTSDPDPIATAFRGNLVLVHSIIHSKSVINTCF